MPPPLALLIWLVLLVLLFHFDAAKHPGTPWTLWVPVIWIFFVASRLPSQWLGGQTGTVAEILEEGNSLDRTIWLVLLLLGIGILLARSFPWAEFIARNLAFVAYVSFALLSILWSDFAFVAFKRWFRDLGSYLMILIVLSDKRPTEALRTVLRRLSYLLIPLSIILIKYYINIGRTYERWSGATMYVGVTTSKNMLGAACMVSGMFFFWDTLTRWSNRREYRTKQLLFVNISFILLTLYLLRLAHSATSAVCLGIGWAVIATAHSARGQRHPTLLKAAIPASFLLYVVLGFGFGLNGVFAEMVGRDPTLTNRTHIWSVLLSIDTNPLFGTGYESFWLGSRLDVVHDRAGIWINEAHNGFLEVYLNLGMIGLLLLILFLISGYITICRKNMRADVTSFMLALMSVVLFSNLTEAHFRQGFVWLVLLLGAIALPEQEEDQVRDLAAAGSDKVSDDAPVFSDSSLEGWSARSVMSS